MKRAIAFWIMITVMMSVMTPITQAEETSSKLAAPVTEAESCILIDAATGKVLFEKHADKKQYPASTTKIMTAALTADLGNIDKTVTVSGKAVKSIGINGSNVGLKAGEAVTVRDLLNMALISSANDAANALAESVSGSISLFVNLMNSKAVQLGLSGTSFSNPVGLDVEDKFPYHMTTARDLAQIMRYASSLQTVRDVIGLSRYQLPVTNLHPQKRGSLSSTNHLMLNSGYHSDAYTVIGGKTGWTKAAQNVFVAAARNQAGVELIVVLMKHPSREGMFQDAKKLFDYGFSRVQQEPGLAAAHFYDVRMRSSEPIIQAFYEQGYLKSAADGRFRYSEPVTLGDFVHTLTQLGGMGEQENQVQAAAGGVESQPEAGTDPKTAGEQDSNTEPCLARALEEGLIDPADIAGAEKVITRGEVILMMDRLLNIHLEDSEIPVFIKLIKDYDTIPDAMKASVLRIYKAGILKGNGDGTIGVDRGLSREEMVLILNNYQNYLKKDNSLVRIVFDDFSHRGEWGRTAANRQAA